MSPNSTAPLQLNRTYPSMQTSPTQIPDAALTQITQLYDQGLYVQAYEFGKTYGPLQRWGGTAAQIRAGQLAGHLGAHQLRRVLHILAWRQDRSNPDSFYHYLYTLWECHGLFAVWKRLAQAPEFPQATRREQGHLLSLEGSIYAKLRDFEQATAKIDRATALIPEDPWIWVVRSRLLEAEDRYSEALEAAENALTFHPQYRAAIAQVAHLLKLQNRDPEALDLLQASVKTLESAEIAGELAELYLELEQPAIAQKTFEHCLVLSPLAEPLIRASWIANIASAAYKAKDIVQAQTWAKKLPSHPSVQAFAHSLLSLNPAGKQIQLPVSFIRQHHMTCAPATLATLCRYWNQPTPHLEIAEEICYNGTSNYSSRTWAETQGWIAKEFTVTWENSQQLIDQGIPFAVSTVEPNSAHLQAIIGYDSCLKLLLVRDPYERDIVEFWAEAFFRKYQGTGPRGLVLVPPDQKDRLEKLNLKDQPLYDQLFAIKRSLESHDRETADGICQQMTQTAPHHRLSAEALITLAHYDTDQPRLLGHLNQMLEIFPKNSVWLLQKSYALEELEYREERLTFLRHLSRQPDAHPAFWQEYAEVLSDNARGNTDARTYLQKASKAMPGDARNYYLLANLMWANRESHMSFHLYRFATCLEPTNTQYARAYFETACQLKQTKSALTLLSQRWETHQQRSSQPAYPLAWAYQRLNRPQDMFAVLKSAQGQHPNDGKLILYRASLNASYGDYLEAEQLLTQAKEKAPHLTWLRTAAEIAQYQGQKPKALQLWQAVIQLDPLATDAAQALTELLTETQGHQTAQAFLADHCQKYPYCLTLNTLWYQYVRDQNLADAEVILQDIIKHHPDNAWARRQLAWQLGQNQEHDAAWAELAIAKELEPHSTSYFVIQSNLFAGNDQISEAKESLREALRLSIDYSWAIQKLMSLCQTQDERKEALEFIDQELSRQVISGEGLLTYYEEAQSILSEDELLNTLRMGQQQRPDLWQAWSTLAQHLSKMGHVAEALTLAKDATAQFPLQTESWLALAAVYEAQKYQDGEISALKQAAQLSPGSSYAVRQLADAYERADQLVAGQTLLEQAIAHEPLEARNYGFLASNLWQADQKTTALEMIEKAIRLKPDYDWAWAQLKDWSTTQNTPETLIQLARSLTQSRAGEAANWSRLAVYLTDPADAQERLKALDQALRLDPKNLDVYELKIELLVANQQYDDALSLCQTSVWGDTPPTLLRGQIAWIEAQRGNVTQAIALMQELLAEETDYHWGWRELARWYAQIGETQKYLATAQSLAEMRPDAAEVWSLLGDAQSQSDQKAAAKVSYRTALEKKPDYQYAALLLFDLELEEGELEQAALILDQVKDHHEDEYYWFRVVQLACEQHYQKTALAALTELCTYATDNEWPLQTAVRSMVQAEWTVQAQDILRKHLTHPQAHPEVGPCWVGCCLTRNQWEECFKVLELFDPEQPLQCEAIKFFLETATSHNKHTFINRYLKSSHQSLHNQNETWAYLGFYFSVNNYQKAVQWYRGWAKRQSLEAWMLLHLSRSLIGLKKYQHAGEVSRRALRLPTDQTTPSHQVLLALVAAWDGSLNEASKVIQAIEHSTLDPSDQFLYFLALALLEAQAKKVPTAQRIKRAIAHATQAVQSYPQYRQGGFWRKLYHHAAWKIAAKTPGLKSFLWAYWQGLKLCYGDHSEMNIEGTIATIILFCLGLYCWGLYATMTGV